MRSWKYINQRSIKIIRLSRNWAKISPIWRHKSTRKKKMWWTRKERINYWEMRSREQIRYLEAKIASIYIFIKDLGVGEKVRRGWEGKLGFEGHFWKSWWVCEDYSYFTWKSYGCWIDYFGSKKFYFLER